MVNGDLAAKNLRAKRQRLNAGRRTPVARSEPKPPKRPFPTDATRNRRYSTDPARRKFYSSHRSARFARRQGMTAPAMAAAR